MIIRIHYNKWNAPKGKPWSINTSKGCYAAAHVIFKKGMETEERPDKKNNPRYFIKCNGEVRWKGKTAIIF